MDSDLEISIKVNIADRIYPLKVKQSEEEFVRKAAKSISDKLQDYRKGFDVDNKEDLLAMCALEAYTELHKLKTSEWIRDDGISEKIAAISKIASTIDRTSP